MICLIMKTLSITMLCVLFFVSQLVGANWPAWRGPTGNGLADNEKFPSSFTNKKNIKWKVELPGSGSSTPAIWEDNIFITSAVDSKDGVTCFDREGQKRWSHTFGNERGGKHKNGSGSNPSPVTDGENVFVYYKKGNMAT